MMSDTNDLNPMNLVLLEGEVSVASDIKVNDNHKFQDIVISVARKTGDGSFRRYSHNAVASDNVLDSFGEFKVGMYVRIRGHLQESTYRIDDDRSFTYSKVRVDFVEK